MELKYTICFIRQGDHILLLNRETPAWMGMWNGVGGKIEKNETPLACIIREIQEETGITLLNQEQAEEADAQWQVHTEPIYRGKITWEAKDGSYAGGMHAFLVEIPTSLTYTTPIKTEEGILDWKKLDWIFHPNNSGVANLKYFLPTILEEDNVYHHHFVYDGDHVATFESKMIKPVVID